MKTPLIRCAKPTFGPRETAALRQAAQSGWLGSGVYAKIFERRVARSIGSPFATATNSGTAALHLALQVLDLAGAEVITTPLTIPATNNAILFNRASPVFCEVEEDTGNIDPARLEELITRKTKAIVVVHLNGHACDMDPVLALARRRRLAVVEDACAALPVDGKYKGRPLGSLGDIGCFSFSGLKNLTAFDGGVAAHRRPEWSARLARLSRLGQRIGPDGPEQRPRGLKELGFHYRMNDVAAVIGLAQFERWDSFAESLRETARRYRDGFAGLGLVEPLAEKPYARRALLYFPIRVRGGRKLALRAFLQRRGIETGDWIFPNHLFDLYKPYRRRLPIAERFAQELLYLPFHPLLTRKEVDRIVDGVRRFKG